jgi:hypothetical protein
MVGPVHGYWRGSGLKEATGMLSEAELRQMSPEQRYELARTLAALDLPPLFDDAKAKTRRNVALAIAIASCIFLVIWIGVLAVTLPSRYRAGNWRGAWIGFDVAELFGFAAIAWAAWRGKQLLIVCMVVTATLLCADAWFDLTLDWGTPDFYFSVLSALCAELPLAVLLILGARRLLRLTVRMQMALEGLPGPVPPLWRVALFGDVPHQVDVREPQATDNREPAASGRPASGPERLASGPEPAG